MSGDLTRRSEQAAERRQHRQAQKLQRELERKAKHDAKLSELEKANLQVATYENRLELLLSLHKEQSERFDWTKLAVALPPPLPCKHTHNETKGRLSILMLSHDHIGSFGENVYKIGLTRRLEPMDRIRELGDSSVPFDFDVHALLFRENAPALEAQLHRHFLERQVNKVNPRKEFFHVALAHIRHEIERLGLSTGWTMTAEATEYRESLAISKALNENMGFRESWIRQQQECDLLDNDMETIEGALIEGDSCPSL